MSPSLCGSAPIMCSRVTAVLPAPDPTFTSLRVGFVQRWDGQLGGGQQATVWVGLSYTKACLHIVQSRVRDQNQPILRLLLQASDPRGQSQSSQDTSSKNNQKLNKHSSQKNNPKTPH